jgi:hypothetical protein
MDSIVGGVAFNRCFPNYDILQPIVSLTDGLTLS